MIYVLKLTCPQYTCLLCLTTQTLGNEKRSHLRQRKIHQKLTSEKSAASSKKSFDKTLKRERDSRQVHPTNDSRQAHSGSNGVWRKIINLKNIATKGKENFRDVITTKKVSEKKSPKKSDQNRMKTTQMQLRLTRKDRSVSIDRKMLIDVRLPSDLHIKNIVFCFTDFPHSCSKEQASIRYKIVYMIPMSLIYSLMNLLCSYFISRCYVNADKILLRGARAHELSIKWMVVLSKTEYRLQCLDILLDVAVACYIAAVKDINILEGLKSTATSITQTAATNTATLGIESAVQVVGNAMAGAAISAIVDVAVSSASIYMAKRQKDEGRITDKEFSVKIKKTVCESSLKFVGGTTGSILGQVLIPVPVVGAFVGGFCGSLIGAGIGKGINYGIFDRNSNKDFETTSVDSAHQFKIYKREYRGYVPKINVYYEDGNYFAEKTFEKGKGKSHNEKLISPSIINRWKTRADSPSFFAQSNESPNKETKANSPMLKWRRIASSMMDTNNSVDRTSLPISPSSKKFSLDDDKYVSKEHLDSRALRPSLSWDSHLRHFSNTQAAANIQADNIGEEKIDCEAKVTRLKRFRNSFRMKTHEKDSLFFNSDTRGDIPNQTDESNKESDKPIKQFILFPFYSVKGGADGEHNDTNKFPMDTQKSLNRKSSKTPIKNLKELFTGSSAEERAEQDTDLIKTDKRAEKSSFGKRASMLFSLKRRQSKVQSPEKAVTKFDCSTVNGKQLSNSNSLESLFNEPWFEMSSSRYNEKDNEEENCNQPNLQFKEKTPFNLFTTYNTSSENKVDMRDLSSKESTVNPEENEVTQENKNFMHAFARISRKFSSKKN